MPYTTRFDLSFGDHSDFAQYLLLLQVSESGLQLLAIDGQKHPLMYRHIQFERESVEQGTGLKEWISDHQDWLRKWSRLVIVHDCLQSTVVPAALYNVDNGKELLDLQFGDLFRGTMLTEQVPGRQDYTVYRIPTEWYQILTASNIAVQHRNLFTLWLGWIEKQPVHDNGQVYLLFEFGRMMMVVRKESLLLVQQYEYQVPEDISYYLLAVLHQFDLSPETVQVLADGWIDTDSSLYLELFKYVRNLKTVKLPEDIQLDTSLLEGQPVHYFTPLIQMATCVS
jgi:Protein of unknown function (DUF3822)